MTTTRQHNAGDRPRQPHHNIAGQEVVAATTGAPESIAEELIGAVTRWDEPGADALESLDAMESVETAEERGPARGHPSHVIRAMDARGVVSAAGGRLPLKLNRDAPLGRPGI